MGISILVGSLQKTKKGEDIYLPPSKSEGKHVPAAITDAKKRYCNRKNPVIQWKYTKFIMWASISERKQWSELWLIPKKNYKSLKKLENPK